MTTDLSNLIFPPYFIHADVILVITDAVELDLCGQTIEVTVYVNTQLIFS
jgi:hypothetical protein